MAARVALLVSMAVLLTACEESGAPPRGAPAGQEAPEVNELPFPVSLTAQQARGRNVFERECASCHGRFGRGSSARTPDASGRLPDLSDKQYATSTTSDLATRFAAAHHETLPSAANSGATRDALSYVPILAYPPDASGSAIRGREIYGRYCSSCHGVHGDGNGPAAALLDTRPSDFTHDPLVAARDFTVLVRDTRSGPGRPHISSMPSWGLVFDEQMLRDVVAYLPTFQSVASGRR